MRLACPTQFPVCFCNHLVGFLMESDQIRSVMFMTGRFAFKYGQFVLMTCHRVLSCYLTTTGWQLFLDKKVTVFDKTACDYDKP